MAKFNILTVQKSSIEVEADEYKIGEKFISFYDERGRQVYTVGSGFVYSIKRENSK